MIDFIEYVVTELKSKRLSKTNAVALVKQFSRGSAKSMGTAVLHPLLHRNSSDLDEQRYASAFTGQEFFLADHQVAPNGQPGRNVLPGVAYLEMARAAVEQAWPERPAEAPLELRNTVWAQPIVVSGRKDVHIALIAAGDDRVEYEIYTEGDGEDVVHCQGVAVAGGAAAPVTLDVEQLKTRMTRGRLTAAGVYASFRGMGLLYGPSFQAISTIRLGNGEVVAELRLPESAAGDAADYVLHPSLLDSASQAAIGLLDGDADATQPRLPFALETLRVLASCTTEMFAWVRYASGSEASDKVVKVDIDLCDERGNVCVEMRGFSWRVLTGEVAADRRPAGILFATPAWQESAVEPRGVEYADRHVLSLRDARHEQYGEHALAGFERVQEILRGKPHGKVLLQVVVEDPVLAGLSAMLKTASLENPLFAGQIVLVPAALTPEEVDHLLAEERRGGLDPLVKYENGTRHVLRWQELIAPQGDAPVAFKDDGVYLITGGRGGLGTLFASEILERTPGARIVLAGRSPRGAEPESDPRRTYRQADLTSFDDVRNLIASIVEEHGRLDGILHSAGMIADNFILRKSSAEFLEVLAPKVFGTIHLDEAAKDVDLDFFVLFSAIGAATGNLGQADYTAANGFLDGFATYRNGQVEAGLRRGRTRAINWPLWQSGGMTVDDASRERLEQTIGMQPMQTATGIGAFHRALELPHDQLLVVEGDLARIRRAVFEVSEPAVTSPEEPEEPRGARGTVSPDDLTEKTQHFLRKQFAELLKLPFEKIDPRAALENYGMDSILAMKLTGQLESAFGSLPKTLFFEYQTIRELSAYFIEQHAAQLNALFVPTATRRENDVPKPQPAAAVKTASKRRSRRRKAAPAVQAKRDEPIAIIGLSGRYPEAVDVEAYWKNLRDGKDCITEVPKERWDWREYFTEDRTENGRHYSKWGGFIEGVDEFDPMFFNLSPLEAEGIDPQERLFLQHVWMAIEDAGYTRAALQVPDEDDLAGQVGVYAGVMYTEYQLFGPEAAARGNRMGVASSAASVANRVSYLLNLHGPSMTLDTMCSSSLTAIHVACQDLKLGRTSLAIAGGVNVSIHPNKYLILSAGQFISSDGHCQSFGEGGDGYIPGEGVGVVVLKRLSEAERDGDRIYGVIRGSAINHGGKTNGYSVPNPQAQTVAIRRALSEAGVDARHVSYVEAHGTGTKLGDPIEIAALSKAFGRYTKDTGFSLIGSAKSNIGHCESAAGVAGLTKVLLQMQHRQIVPSLHSAQLNPHIDFESTPFVVNQTLRAWEQPVIDGRSVPRIAGISSFGAGGSNAHMIVEEYQSPVRQTAGVSSAAIVLSARTPEQLRQKARGLVEFLERQTTNDLAALAYTLQTGREPMEERLGFVVGSVEELLGKMRAWLGGEQGIEQAYQGAVKRGGDSLSLFSTDADLKQTVDRWISGGRLSRLLELWVKGLELDWTRLYGEPKPRRITLPAYPFARERYWVDITAGAPAAIQGQTAAVLHPLLHSNTSDLSEQRYRSTFTGDEFFLADHKVKDEKVLPGVAYLEMARTAVEHALPERPEGSVLELRNVVWVQPVVVREATPVHIALVPADDGRVDYEIYSGDAVHGQGSALLSSAPAPARIDVERLKAQMSGGRSRPDAVYAALTRMGLTHGASLRAVTAIHRGDGQVVAELALPAAARHGEYVLHPALMDGALQAAVALLGDPSALPVEPRIPFALDSLRVFRPCTPSMTAWVRYAAGTDILDIDLCDEAGNVCVEMRGLASRTLGRSNSPSETGLVLAAPAWRSKAIELSSSVDLEERYVVLCNLPAVDVEELGDLLSLSECLFLCTDEKVPVAQRYSDYAVDCLELLQAILHSKPEGNVLVQIVAADQLFAGLSALLKTAAMENPRLLGQFVLVPAGITAGDLYAQLEAEIGSADPLVRYRGDAREILEWLEVAEQPDTFAFKDDGVYLITGGRGALGSIFANDIVERTGAARVVLAGRSASNGAEPHARQAYRQVDLEDLDDVRELVESIQTEYGRLDGILHSAGMIADGSILRKDSAEFRRVLAPKVTGTANLDEATKDIALDFFVLFSSIAGATGNAGQADYAAANAFMDSFASVRNARVDAGERHGRTRSIDWPLWQAGGMSVDATRRELLQHTTGMHPMRTATGVEAFHRTLALPYDRTLVVEGDVTRIRRTLFGTSAEVSVAEIRQPSAAVEITAAPGLAEKTQDYLRREFSELLKVPFQRIDPEAELENYGIDSVLAMRLTNKLEKTFGSLSKTLFFEYQTIAALAGYFVKAHAGVLQETLGLGETRVAEVVPAAVAITAPARKSRNRFLNPTADVREDDVAIVGLSGRYPQAGNLADFWSNLQNGRDCVTEVPADRWDYKLYFDPDRNKAGTSYSKWGGFIDGVDRFDPLFFNMSPKEAELVDPQERLFLEVAWETIEDAGYAKESVSGGRVGVYVGAMWNHYELFGAESLSSANLGLPTSSHASIANRVSYFFDFHGPSIGLDTMCSSSLTAMHLACEALRRGEIDAAIAGGVNVTIHPYKHLTLSQGKFAASDGRCRSFGAGGDGYVPGEGVGAVLLKPLAQARADGDQIYAVIRSSSVNHGGKTNGYTVPNPNAQADLIAEALRKGKIDPNTLSYLETHGTGTSLGDPIEITGLAKAFAGANDRKQFVPIGSVKSNIGHLESAAGIAAVTKSLLQLKYNQLVPSIHADPLNPNIDFANTPFYVQTELAEWKRSGTLPRRIGVSSFGAGGSNAHLILEEYPEARQDAAASVAPQLFVLAAKNPDALRRYAERMARFLGNSFGDSLEDIAYTSQIGRTPMDVRLAIVATNVDELRAKLEGWLESRADLEGVFHGNRKDAPYSANVLTGGPAGKAFLEALLTNRELEKVAQLWVLGAAVDWQTLYRHGAPRKVSLPTYPFARERCWIAQPAPSLRPSLAVAAESRTTSERIEARRTYHVPQWLAQALAHTATQPGAGPILILDESNELTLALGADSIIVAHPGQAFDELFDQLARDGRLPRAIVHHAPRPCNLEDVQDVSRDLNDGVYALFELCKALRKYAGPRRLISLFSGPLGAAIGGFFRTLTLEDPSWQAKAIEVGAGISVTEKAALLRNELAEADWAAHEIRYEGGARLVRTLVPLAEARTASPLPLKQEGVYLITGGMGGLGILFAEHLAKTCRARLVLVGRSTPNVAQQAKLRQLEADGAEVLVLSADVTEAADMERVVGEAKARFSRLDGVIHAAGVNRDAFISRKSREEIQAVLAPKVYGTIHLDRATSGEELDFFVLFSSIAAVTGNAGQSDYAFANRFMDAFAERRAVTRSGRTLSINWPLWEEGGMTIPREQLAILEQQTGMSPLPAQEGIRCWEDILRTGAVQVLPFYGNAGRLAAFLGRQPARRVAAAAREVDANQLFAATESWLKERIGEEIRLDADRIGSTDSLESFGLDSVMINKLNARFESDLGALPKTLLYEQETVRALATYLVREAKEALVSLFGFGGADAEPELPAAPESVLSDEVHVSQTAERHRHDDEAIAIIGIHGNYPQSPDLRAYWENLRDGRDLTGVVPADRWNAEELYHPDPAAVADGKIYGKWGGFIQDHDKFDPQFFKISSADAKVIDPQERLFLESVWTAIEDAGYTRDRLRARHAKGGSADVGVFVGVTTNSYQLWAPEERMRGNFVSPSAMPWSIANRVSYFFDFNGPSLPVDTACSSSLVAIHLACESLRNRECQVAIAGGVNLYLHPAKYQSLCQRRMLSVDGKTHSYGAGDDGFVPGEGVGTLVLKPLAQALADGDRVYAVIRSSAFDHSGRANGYSAPNPNAQARLIGHTLEKAGIHPETISYVEGHGTGTQLGDSLEIAALTQAFREKTDRNQFCAVGSVKANVGHSESAAGIAGLAKVLLQMQHGELAPTIHSEEANPNIEFAQSPFYLQHGLSAWPASGGHPRRALINSFGAGGVNACVVVEEYVEEYVEARVEETHAAGPVLFTLSARNEDRLRDYAGRLLAHLRTAPAADLGHLCYTLQTGREAMEERLAIVASGAGQLITRLEEWMRSGSEVNVHRGSLGPRRGSKRSLKLVRTGVGDESLMDLVAKWVAGEEVEWDSLYTESKPRRISVPTYPFARERYWISDVPAVEVPALSGTLPISHLHPLIAYNSSTLQEVRFSSSISDTAFYAVDHKVHDQSIFPGAAFLEMACIAGNIAGERRVRKIKDVVWIQPLGFRAGSQSLRTILRHTAGGADFEICSFDDENETVVHSEGKLEFGAALSGVDDCISVEALKAQCANVESGEGCYERFSALGLHYGPAFRTIEEIRVNETFALAKLRLADHLKGGFDQFILHPSLIDGALQTIASLAGGLAPRTPYLPFALDEIELVKPVTRSCYAYAERADAQAQNHAGVTKFNIRLVNDRGEVLVRMKNLYVRPLARTIHNESAAEAEPATGRLLSLSGGAVE